MIQYTDKISPEEYMELRRKVGWMEFPLEEARNCVENAYMVTCVRDEGRAIGVVRLLWDGGYVAFLSDVIVIPEYQGQGIGRTLVEAVIKRIKDDMKPGYKVKLNLNAAKGKEPFYEKFGFRERPNEEAGAGMDQWLSLDNTTQSEKSDYLKNAIEYWEGVHKPIDRDSIPVDDWLDIFEDMIRQCKSPVLDLGCGTGNDTLYLTEKGKQVISCDQSVNAINNIRKNFPEILEARCFNMLEGLPFEDGSFELVIADLCLHYFMKDDTDAIISEIRRVLVPGGHLIFRVNSVNDVNHGAGQGTEIEPHLFETDKKTIKRFFDEEDIRSFFGDFEIEYLNEEIMTRYRLEKRLFRVCCRKR